MVCLDTEFLIAFLRGDEGAASTLEKVQSKGLTSATTILNAYELFKGAAISSAPERNMKLVRELLDALVVLPLSVESCRTAAEIHARLRAEGEMVSEFDILIAGIATESQEKLISRDEHFGRIKGLESGRW